MAECAAPWAPDVMGEIEANIAKVETMAETALATLATNLQSLNTAANQAISGIANETSVEDIPLIETGGFEPPTFDAVYLGQEVTTPGILDQTLENEFTSTAYPQNHTGGYAPETLNLLIGSTPQNPVGTPPSDKPTRISLANKPSKPVLNDPEDVIFVDPAYSGFAEGLLVPTLPSDPAIGTPGTPDVPALTGVTAPPTPTLTGAGSVAAPTITGVGSVTAPTLTAPGTVAAPTLTFGTLDAPPTVTVPDVGAPPELTGPEAVLIDTPDVSGLLAKFDELVANAPADPDFSYVTPEYAWLLARLDAANLPDAPAIGFDAPDFAAAQAALAAALASLLERPDLTRLTPIEVDVTFTDPPPDTTTLEAAAEEMGELARAFVPDVLATMDAVTQKTDAAVTASGLTPVISALQARLGEMLSASEDRIGLPAVVETAMRERAFYGVDRESFKLERQTVENWLARGFTLPGGILAAQVQGIKQLGFDKKNELSRDIFIESAKLKLESLWNAIKTGIDYEFKYREHYQRALELSIKMVDSKLTAFKSLIEAFSESVKVALAVWQGKLQAKELLAKLIIARAEAEIKQLEGAIALYEADAKLLSAKIQAIDGLIKIGMADVEVQKAENEAHVDLYKAAISAYNAEVDAVKALMGIPGLEADLEKARISAEADEYRAKSDGWKTQLQVFPDAVKVELAKVDVGKARVDAERLKVEYSGVEIQGYQAEIEGVKAQISGEDARVRGYTAQVAGYEAGVRGESTKVTLFNAEVDFEKAKLQHESSKVQLYQNQIELEKARVQEDGMRVQAYQGQIELEKAVVQSDGLRVQAYQSAIDLEKAVVQGDGLKIQAYQSEIELEKAKVQVDGLHVQVYQTKLELEKAKATYNEVLSKKSELEIEKDKLNIAKNQLEVQQQQNKVALERERANLFAGEVQAFQAEINAAIQDFEAYKAEIQGYAAQVQGYAAQVQGFVAETSGEEARARVHAADVQAFAAHVQAYGVELDGWKTQEMTKAETEKARQAATVAMMQGAITAMDKIIERNKGEMMAYDAAVRKYGAGVEGKKIQYEVTADNQRTNIANQMKELQIKISKATTEADKMIEKSRLLLTAYNAQATSASQVVAGAMSALNTSLSASQARNVGDSRSCSTSYNYDL